MIEQEGATAPLTELLHSRNEGVGKLLLCQRVSIYNVCFCFSIKVPRNEKPKTTFGAFSSPLDCHDCQSRRRRGTLLGKMLQGNGWFTLR